MRSFNYSIVSDLWVFPDEGSPIPSSEAKSSNPKSTLEARLGPRSSSATMELRSSPRLLEERPDPVFL